MNRTLFCRSTWRALIVLSAALLVTGCLPAASVPEAVSFTGEPIVQLAAPLDNDTYQAGASVNILVRVDNAGESIGRVALRVNDEIIGEVTEPNPAGAAAFTVVNSWNPSEPGEYVISVDASRLDGTASTPATARIQVVSRAALADPTAMPTAEPAAEEPETTVVTGQGGAQTDNAQPESQAPTAVPTNTAAPTAVPPTATPTAPQVRVINELGVNVRQGPSTSFPAIGSYAQNATAELVAVNPQGTWYKVRYFNGEGWVFGSAVETIGSVAGLPTDAGPPTPVPTNTVVPPTATAVPSLVDLSITDADTSPFPFECGRDSEIIVTIVNTGSDTSTETTVIVEDLFNGQVIASTLAPVPPLGPNEAYQAVLYLRVDTNVAEGHTSRIRVDPENRVAETNENNNVDQDDYVLVPC